MFDDPDGDYLDPIDTDPSDYDDARNDHWGDDDDSPDDGNERDLDPDDQSLDRFWREWHERNEAEHFLELGLPIW